MDRIDIRTESRHAAKIRILVSLALLSALAMARPTPMLAESGPSKADATAIRAVIQAQLAAFRRDDAAGAFAYAAPGIQQQFGTPQAFLRMVRDDYAPVYRPVEVIYRPLQVKHGRWLQPLLVTAQTGDVYLALYQMERQPDGSWRIGGVRLLATEGQGA